MEYIHTGNSELTQEHVRRQTGENQYLNDLRQVYVCER